MPDNGNMAISADQAGKLRALITANKSQATFEQKYDFPRGWNDCADWVLMMMDRVGKGG